MIGLDEYLKIKDNYCLYYLGNNNELIKKLQFRLLELKKELKNINFYLFLNDNIVGFHDAIPVSKLEEMKKNFSYIREFSDSDEIF